MRSPALEPDVDRDAKNRRWSADRRSTKPEEWVVGEPLPGTRWVVQGRLGHGGMGIVLQVCKSPAGIPGAMKVMRPALAQESSWTQQFLAEARLLASVRHPNIVEVIDYDTLADGTPFLVMALLHGQTLRRFMRAARVDGLTITPRNVFAVVSQLCEGLLVLHSQRPPVVHGDVKPENIFLQDVEHMPGSGVVKLLDFGLARAAGRESSSLFGTPRYMAPEQLRGEAVSERADQYSAALVAYEMLTGQFPWDVQLGDVDAMIEAHLMKEPAPPSTFCPWVSPNVDRAIVRALAKHPADRWESVAEFVERLRELQSVDERSAYANAEVNTTAPMGKLAVGTLAASQTTDSLPIEPLQEVLCSTVPGRAPPEVMRLASASGTAGSKTTSSAPRKLARKTVAPRRAGTRDNPAGRARRPAVVRASAPAWALVALVAMAIVGVDTNATKESGDGHALDGSQRPRTPESTLDSASVGLERAAIDAELVQARSEPAGANVVPPAASPPHPTARPVAVNGGSTSPGRAPADAKGPPSADVDEWKRTMDDSPPTANEPRGDESDPFLGPLSGSR